MFGRLGYFLYLYYIKGVRVHHLLNNQPPEWEKIQTQLVMNFPKLERMSDGRKMLMFTIKTKEELIEILKKDPKMSRFGYTFEPKDDAEMMELLEILKTMGAK